MIELPLVFVAGILGTAHCLGMCGPFALAIGNVSGGWLTALGRQAAYTAGRAFTYAVLGAAAGFCGSRLTALLPVFVNIPAALAIVAGLLLTFQGLKAAGCWPQGIGSRWRKQMSASGVSPARRLSSPPVTCLAGGFLGQFLRQPRASGVFLAGVFTGLLPCGLLYGMLALATSTHSLLLGATTMIVFGLGTAPAMMLAGLGGRLVSLTSRRWLYAAAAWCLILTGMVSVVRGISFISIDNQPRPGCPMCQK